MVYNESVLLDRVKITICDDNEPNSAKSTCHRVGIGFIIHVMQVKDTIIWPSLRQYIVTRHSPEHPNKSSLTKRAPLRDNLVNAGYR